MQQRVVLVIDGGQIEAAAILGVDAGDDVAPDFEAVQADRAVEGLEGVEDALHASTTRQLDADQPGVPSGDE